jgi:hypothetical protein
MAFKRHLDNAIEYVTFSLGRLLCRFGLRNEAIGLFDMGVQTAPTGPTDDEHLIAKGYRIVRRFDHKGETLNVWEHPDGSGPDLPLVIMPNTFMPSTEPTGQAC